MSTHNIGFYEDLTKIIFALSSNIIKYAPYFSCCREMGISLLHDKTKRMACAPSDEMDQSDYLPS